MLHLAQTRASEAAPAQVQVHELTRAPRDHLGMGRPAQFQVPTLRREVKPYAHMILGIVAGLVLVNRDTRSSRLCGSRLIFVLSLFLLELS